MKILSIFLMAIALVSAPIGFAKSRHGVGVLATQKSMQHQKVNLNTADVKILQRLKGIGRHKAQSIVAYRKQHGRFKSINDLVKVRGISQRILKQLRGELVIS